MKEKIRSILEINRIPASPELPEQLEIYLRLLKEWNSKMDLIAEAPDDEILDRHFADSLTVLRTGLIPDDAKWIDVGTGAGFPGLPLAIARPDIRMTLMDAQQKRLNFLQAVIRETGIPNACTVHMRAEEGARNPEYREKFDIASARAVAPLCAGKARHSGMNLRQEGGQPTSSAGNWRCRIPAALKAETGNI